MSVRVKLVVIVLFAALVPLTVSAFTALSIHRRAFDSKSADLQRHVAESGAFFAQESLNQLSRNLLLSVRSVDWSELSAEERTGALWLIFHQLDHIAAVALVDGNRILESAFLAEAEELHGLADHPRMSEADMARFAAAIPAMADQVALGDAFPLDGGGPLVPVAVALPHPEPWVVAVAVSLRAVCSKLATLTPDVPATLVVDARGRLLCGGSAPLGPIAPGLARALPKALTKLARFRHEDGSEAFAAAATTATGWFVVATQPAETALAPGRRMRDQTLFWIAVSVLVAVAAGSFLARSITRPVGRLTAGAHAVASGDLSFRLSVDGRDEFAALGRSFNHMSEELERRNAEIEAWNAELQKRVEEKTRELKEAQRQLLESQKIAAVSSLGAGVAHEINNPLTGVLGLAQVLRLRAKENGFDADLSEKLALIENEAQRIRDIVQTLLSLSGDYGGASLKPAQLTSIINESLRLVTGQLEQRGILVSRNYAGAVPDVLGDTAQLRQVFLNLFRNAITAMPRGGVLQVDVDTVEGDVVRVVIADTGRGIARDHLRRVFDPFFTTKQEWSSQGLGLTVAYRIVEEHHGNIRIESEQKKGTVVTIKLPIARGPHLA